MSDLQAEPNSLSNSAHDPPPDTCLHLSLFGKYPTHYTPMLLSAFKKSSNSSNNTRKPRRSSWAVGVGRHINIKSRVGIAPASNAEADEIEKRQPTKPKKKKKVAATSRRGKSSMTSSRVGHPETKNHPTNINVPLGVVAVDVVQPLMTQDELHRAKKKCHTTAHRLHKIKRRLLLDIAEEQSMTSEAASRATPPTTAGVERSTTDREPTTTTSNRRPRRGRRNRTASFMPRHQNSDSTMETFFGASGSSFDSSLDDTENAGAGGD